MQIKKFQKYYVRSLYKSNISKDINNIITNFKIKFNFNINLTKIEIYKEKYYVTGPINNLDIENLCTKFINYYENIKYNAIDIFNEFKNNKNKIEQREEKVIMLTTKNIEEKLKSNNIDNYFIDVTYKVVPKYNKNKYKLLIIIGIDNNSKSSYLCALILIKYEDSNSFNKIFSYLNNKCEFNPRIVHIDYSVSLTKSLKEGDFFKKNLL